MLARPMSPLSLDNDSFNKEILVFQIWIKNGNKYTLQGQEPLYSNGMLITVMQRKFVISAPIAFSRLFKNLTGNVSSS